MAAVEGMLQSVLQIGWLDLLAFKDKFLFSFLMAYSVG
jgi:hypothetical protein